jgi:hypothetical protein
MTAALSILNEVWTLNKVVDSVMKQLSVHLPAARKMLKSKYQVILDRDIPSVSLAGDALLKSLLVLHKSSKLKPDSRRVSHFEPDDQNKIDRLR